MAENIRLMASLVGRVIEIENPEEERYANRNFGRARVEVDAEKPLVPGFLAPRPEGLDDVWIQVKYEKLVRYYFNCGKLGHESKTCEEETVELLVNGVTHGYDASLCIQMYREQGKFSVYRNQGRQPEMKGLHREEESNKCGYRERSPMSSFMEAGETSRSQMMGGKVNNSKILTQISQMAADGAQDNVNKCGVLFNNDIFQKGEMDLDVGYNLEA